MDSTTLFILTLAALAAGTGLLLLGFAALCWVKFQLDVHAKHEKACVEQEAKIQEHARKLMERLVPKDISGEMRDREIRKTIPVQ